jgi:hypothetical protein
MDKSDKLFGFVIAYIAPGLVALYAIAPYSEKVNNLLLSGNGSPSAASLAPMTILTIITGMCINAFGALSTKLVFRKLMSSPATDKDIAALQPEHIAVYEKIVEHSYRYFECYNNTAISFLLLTGSINLQPILLGVSNPLMAFHTVGLIAVAVLCLVAAYYNYLSFTIRVKALVNKREKEIDMCGGGGPSPTSIKPVQNEQIQENLLPVQTEVNDPAKNKTEIQKVVTEAT